MMMHARRDRSTSRVPAVAMVNSSARATRALALGRVAAGVMAMGLAGAPGLSQAQYFMDRATIPPASVINVQASSGCPAWLTQPYIVEALRQGEPGLAQKLDNKAALARLLNARSLAGQDVLFDAVRSDLGTTVLSATIRNSNSPRPHEEASERASFVEGMSIETMTACLPRIANLLSEAEGRVAGTDKADVDHEAQARSPRGRMLTVYGSYAALQACLRSRAGRLLAYVTKEDVDDARNKSKAVEHRLLREDPSLDVGALWGEATKPVAPSTDLLTLAFDPNMVGRYDVDQGDFSEHGKAYCQRARRRIDSVYGELFADATKPKKDF